MFKVEHFNSTEGNHDWLIRQFEIFHFKEYSLEEKFIPRPDISLVFHFRDVPLIVDKVNIQLEPYFIAPIIPQSIVLKFHGEMDTFIVAFKPTVISRIFGLNLTPVAKRSISLPRNIFFPLWQTLSGMTTTEQRIGYFTDFIFSHQQTPYIPDEIDELYDKIVEKGTTTLLKDIMLEYSHCSRTLQRNFIKRTGVSPKTLMRIVRFDFLWSKIKQENAIDYQNLVFDGNYFDQSHLINDFKSIIGETPNYFFHRNLQVVKMFSGKSEGKM